MCQFSDSVHLALILHSEELISVQASGELDGEPFRWEAKYQPCRALQDCLEHVGALLDAQRLSFDHELMTEDDELA